MKLTNDDVQCVLWGRSGEHRIPWGLSDEIWAVKEFPRYSPTEGFLFDE